MTRSLRCFLISLVALAMPLFVNAQTIAIPYTMSFEDADAAELANWVLNPGTAAAQCADKWIVGSAVHSDGKKSLYITSDDSNDPIFGTQPDVQFVYRDFQLPAGGTYTISFDWMCEGAASTALYAGLTQYAGAPTATPTGAASFVKAIANSGVMPAVLTRTGLLNAKGQSSWQSYTFAPQIASANNTLRLYFGFANANRDSAAMALSACIDNIQIVDSRYTAPENISITTISCDSVLVQWTNHTASAQLQYRKVGTNTWSTRSSDTSHPDYLYLENMSEGSYEIRVRGVAVDQNGVVQYTAYTYSDEFVLYCPELHCINYFNLSDENVVTCSRGEYSMDTYTKVPSSYVAGLVDNGSWSPNSRHTVMWDATETDPRTGGALKVVPPGALASVRLHTWNPSGRYYSAVDYVMTVDPDDAILLLKYALVQEYASYHSPTAEEQARFFLQIQDLNGNPLSGTCGEKTLRAGYDSDNWEWEGKQNGVPLESEMVVWKDWSTMGVDLTTWAGQTIRIHMEASGCAESAHYGYAYFTLDCASATIKTTSCGDNVEMTVEAPEGFNYEWFDQTGKVLSTNRVWSVPAIDASEFTCRLTDLEVSDCYFDLTTKAVPRFPIVDFSYKYDPQDCQNRVVFTNKSYVQTQFEGEVENHYDEECAGYEWSFSDGALSSQKDCVHTFPQEGGTFTVTMAAWIAEGLGACYKDTVFEVVLPKIGASKKDTIIDRCDGDFYQLGDQRIITSGDYEERVTSRAGCDSVVTHHVSFHPVQTIKLDTATLCFGDVLQEGKDSYQSTEAGKHEWIRYLQNQYNCDSTVIIPIVVKDEILPDITIQEVDENHETSLITLGGVGYDYYTLDGVRNGNLENLPNGNYQITFYNDYGCALDTLVHMGGCLRELVFQRWNDVLSIKDSIHNGGRTFDTFQWYKDEVIIPGATKSYFYQAGGLEANVEYTCEVTHKDPTTGELIVETTCPFKADLVNPRPVSVNPTQVRAGDQVVVTVPEDCLADVYTTMGIFVKRVALSNGANNLTMPSNAGVYLINVVRQDTAESYRVCVTD